MNTTSRLVTSERGAINSLWGRVLSLTWKSYCLALVSSLVTSQRAYNYEHCILAHAFQKVV